MESIINLKKEQQFNVGLTKDKLNYQELIERFINYIDVSENTMITYKRSLKQFILYLHENNIKQPTRDNILEFKEYLVQNNKPNTVNLYLASVKNFFKWLEYEDITKDISKNIKPLKIGKEHLKQALTLEEIQSVLNSAKNIRERVIILLGVSLGLRANEMANIRLEDFKSKSGEICLYLLGKGRDYKQDYVIVPSNILEVIKEYIRQYNIEDYLLVSNSNHSKNNQITTTSIRRIVKDMFRRVGLDSEEYSLHSLRHSFATISIQNGNDIRQVSQALRHSSTAISEIYLHDLEKLDNKCSKTISNLLFNVESEV